MPSFVPPKRVRREDGSYRPWIKRRDKRIAVNIGIEIGDWKSKTVDICYGGVAIEDPYGDLKPGRQILGRLMLSTPVPFTGEIVHAQRDEGYVGVKFLAVGPIGGEAFDGLFRNLMYRRSTVPRVSEDT